MTEYERLTRAEQLVKAFNNTRLTEEEKSHSIESLRAAMARTGGVADWRRFIEARRCPNPTSS